MSLKVIELTSKNLRKQKAFPTGKARVKLYVPLEIT